MTTKEHAELPTKEVMRLARTRADELIKRVSPRIPAEAQSLLSEEMENVLRVFSENMPALRGTPDDEII